MIGQIEFSTAGGPRRRTFLGVLSCILVAAGCQSGPYESAPVDEAMAQETLERVMESWKSGESIETLRDETPSVVVQDFDWAGGAQWH